MAVVGLGAASVWEVLEEEVIACCASPVADSPLVGVLTARRVGVWACTAQGVAGVGEAAWRGSGTGSLCWSGDGRAMGALRKSEEGARAGFFVVEASGETALDPSEPAGHGPWGLRAAAPKARFDDVPALSRVEVRQTWQSPRALPLAALRASPFYGHGQFVAFDRRGTANFADVWRGYQHFARPGDVRLVECVSTGHPDAALVVLIRATRVACGALEGARRRAEVAVADGEAIACAGYERKAHPHFEARLAVAWAKKTFSIHAVFGRGEDGLDVEVVAASSLRGPAEFASAASLAWAPGGECVAVARGGTWGVWDGRRSVVAPQPGATCVAWVLGGTTVAAWGDRRATVVPTARVARSRARASAGTAALCCADRVYVLLERRWVAVRLPVPLARAPPARLALVSECGSFVAICASRGVAVVRIDAGGVVELDIARRAVDIAWCGDHLLVLYDEGALLEIYERRRRRKYRFFEPRAAVAAVQSPDGRIVPLKSLVVLRLLDVVAVGSAWRLVVGRAAGILGVLELDGLEEEVDDASSTSSSSRRPRIVVLSERACPADVAAAFYSPPPRDLLVALGDDGCLLARSGGSAWATVGRGVQAVFCGDFGDETAAVAYGGRNPRRATRQPAWSWSSTFLSRPREEEEEDSPSFEEEEEALPYCVAATPRGLEALVVMEPGDWEPRLSVVAGGAEASLRLLVGEAARRHAARFDRMLATANELAADAARTRAQGFVLASWRARRGRRRASEARAEIAKAVAQFVAIEPRVAEARDLVQRRWDRRWVARALAVLLGEACESSGSSSFLETRVLLALSASLPGGLVALHRVVAAAGRPMDERALARLFWTAGRPNASTLSAPPARVFADAIRLGDRRVAASLVGLVGYAGDRRGLARVSRVLLRECFAARLDEEDDADDDAILSQAWAFARKIEQHHKNDDDDDDDGDCCGNRERRTTDELAATFALNGLVRRPTPRRARVVADTLLAIDWTPPSPRRIKYAVRNADAVVDALAGAFPDLFDDDDDLVVVNRDGSRTDEDPGAARLFLVARAYGLEDWRVLLGLALNNNKTTPEDNKDDDDDDFDEPSPSLARTLAESLRRRRKESRLQPALDALAGLTPRPLRRRRDPPSSDDDDWGPIIV